MKPELIVVIPFVAYLCALTIGFIRSLHKEQMEIWHRGMEGLQRATSNSQNHLTKGEKP